MMHSSRNIRAAAISLMSLLLSTGIANAQNSPQQNRESAAAVDSTLRRYASMVTSNDHYGIANLFTPDGELVNPGQVSIKGREAIDRALSALGVFQIIENQTTPTSTAAFGNTATQTGTYQQRIRVPSGQTIAVSGVFKAEWRRASNGQWLIQRMETTPSVVRSH